MGPEAGLWEDGEVAVGGGGSWSNRRELTVGGLMGHKRGVGLILGCQPGSVLRSPDVF